MIDPNSALADRVKALAEWLLRDRETFTHRELVTVLVASFDDATSELRSDLVEAVRAHDSDVARLGVELRDARDQYVQAARERDKAREELDELRVLATNAIDELRAQLEEAVDVSAAALAALAGQPIDPAARPRVERPAIVDVSAEPLCDGSGIRRAYAVVGGRVRPDVVELPCPGCSACGYAARNGEVHRG